MLAVEQQEFGGFWNANKDIAKLLNISEDQLASSKPEDGKQLLIR